MALVPTTLQQSIKAAVVAARQAAQGAPNIEAATEAYDTTLSAMLSVAIDAYIKTGTVVTVGSAVTQTGTIT